MARGTKPLVATEELKVIVDFYDFAIYIWRSASKSFRVTTVTRWARRWSSGCRHNPGVDAEGQVQQGEARVSRRSEFGA